MMSLRGKEEEEEEEEDLFKSQGGGRFIYAMDEVDQDVVTRPPRPRPRPRSTTSTSSRPPRPREPNGGGVYSSNSYEKPEREKF